MQQLLPDSWRNFGLELELESLLGADLLEGLGDLHVDAHSANVGQKLDGRYLVTKTKKHLKTNTEIYTTLT